MVSTTTTSAQAARDAPPVTYSRKKKTKRTDDDEEEKKGEDSIDAFAPPTTTSNKVQPPQPPPTAPAPPPPQKKSKKKPLLTQTHLDLGQTAFVCTTCRQCGMVYAPGDSADERLHRAFHADALQGPKLLVGGASSSSSSSSALLEAISFGASSSGESGSSGSGGGGKNKTLAGRILHAPPGPGLGGAGARRALAVAEAAFGAVPGWLLGISIPAAKRARCDGEEEGEGREELAPSSSCSKPLPAAALATCGKHAFFFECAATRRAVGVAVVETLASGTRLTKRRRGSGAAETATETAETTAAETTTETETTTAGAVGAALGVRGVWVAPSYRRRGIATALLDAARARAVAYTVVTRRALVAFSQPTDAGGGEALARRYASSESGDGGFLSYL